jgi:predicted XRE-type DNA-binding protein
MAKIKQTQKATVKQNIERLKAKQIDPISLSKDINSIAFLVDIIEGRSNHISDTLRAAGEFKFADDIYIKNIIHYTRFMQKSVSKLLGLETAEHFGDKVDFINDVIQIAGDAKTEEQKMQILSTLKMIVK